MDLPGKHRLRINAQKTDLSSDQEVSTSIQGTGLSRFDFSPFWGNATGVEVLSSRYEKYKHFQCLT